MSRYDLFVAATLVVAACSSPDGESTAESATVAESAKAVESAKAAKAAKAAESAKATESANAGHSAKAAMSSRGNTFQPLSGTDTAAVESTDILARDPVTDKAEIKHVLIGWADLASVYGGRMAEAAQTRSKADADSLARDILDEARKGADFVTLMKEYSEDWGSAESGQSYTATPDAGLVPPFKKLSLRLEVGETGAVLTKFGWHVIKRIS